MQDGHPFTEAEEEQLRTLFGCSEQELRTVLEASAYIFEQAAYQGMAAEPLYEFLLEAGFDDAHAKVRTPRLPTNWVWPRGISTDLHRCVGRATGIWAALEFRMPCIHCKASRKDIGEPRLWFCSQIFTTGSQMLVVHALFARMHVCRV